jgi:hypothetical protein
MIDMGYESKASDYPCYVIVNGNDTWNCPSIVIEHLGIIGNLNENGIVNCCAQELSRVNDVSISNATTGLALSDQFAQNSGPYSNLTISGVNTCLSIGLNGKALVNSRGVHGLTCSVNSGNLPAITIDGPDNSLEDITISGVSTPDGIFIGSQAPAEGNMLFNKRLSYLKFSRHFVSPNLGGLEENWTLSTATRFRTRRHVPPAHHGA